MNLEACEPGKLRTWKTCEPGNLRTWKRANPKTCGHGSVRTWKLPNLETCEPGSLRTWKLANLEACEPGNLRTWKACEPTPRHAVWANLTAPKGLSLFACLLPRTGATQHRPPESAVPATAAATLRGSRAHSEGAIIIRLLSYTSLMRWAVPSGRASTWSRSLSGHCS